MLSLPGSRQGAAPPQEAMLPLEMREKISMCTIAGQVVCQSRDALRRLTVLVTALALGAFGDLPRAFGEHLLGFGEQRGAFGQRFRVLGPHLGAFGVHLCAFPVRLRRCVGGERGRDHLA